MILRESRNKKWVGVHNRFFLLSYTDYQRLKIFFENDYVFIFNTLMISYNSSLNEPLTLRVLRIAFERW